MSPTPRPPKPPLFTTKLFSTKSWGPGHVVGAGILAVGMYAVVKAFVGRGQAEADRTRSSLAQTATVNVRGQYGRTS